MSVKLFHTADLHLGAGLSYLSEKATERRFEIVSVFKRLTQFCVSQDINICLIAGDLFDSNQSAGDIAPSVFEYIKSAPSVKFLYVAGNHDPLDAASYMNSAALPENLYVFGGEYEVREFPELGVRIIGKSFVHSSMESGPFATVLPEDELLNIMLLHADIGSDKNSPYNPIDRDFIENSGVDYLALGHIHKRTAPAKFGKTTFAYPGCPEGQGFDEEGVKGGYLVELDRDRCDISFVKLCRRVHRVASFDVSDATSSVGAAELIREKLEENFGEKYADDLYRITLTGSIGRDVKLNVTEIKKLLCDDVYFIKLKDNTHTEYDLDSLKLEISLKGIFTRKMLEKISAADEREKPLLESALYIGLSAFDSGVALNED